MKKTVIIMLALFVNTWAMADSLPPSYNKLNFNVYSERVFENDQLNVTLYAKIEDRKSSNVASRINQIMGEALILAKTYSAIKVKTGNYTINPIYSQENYKNRKIVRWAGQQSLILASTDIKAVTELMQKLQSSLQVSSTNFSISDEARKKAEDAMVEEALQKFKSRAQEMIETLGATSYKIVKLNLNTPNSRPPQPMYRGNMMMKSEAMAMDAPALAGGEDKLRVSVSAEIELQF